MSTRYLRAMGSIRAIAIAIALVLGGSCSLSRGDADSSGEADEPQGALVDLCSVFTTRAGASFSYVEHLGDDPPFTEGKAEGVAAEVYFAVAANYDAGEGAPLARYLAEIAVARADDERAVGPAQTDAIRDAAQVVDRTRASGKCDSSRPIGQS